MENRAPNNGDGNNDGVPDSQQPDVASIPSAGGNGYITIQTDSSCGAIEKVHACLEQSLSEDPEYACPLGLVGFEIPCSPARMKGLFLRAAGWIRLYVSQIRPFARRLAQSRMVPDGKRRHHPGDN